MKRISIFCVLLVLFTSVSGCIVPTPVVPSGTTQTAALTPVTIIPTPLPTGSATIAVTPPPLPTFTAIPATPTLLVTTVTVTTAPPASETPVGPTGGISPDLLKNFTYVVENPNTKVTLKDGVYSGDHINSRLVEPIAFGDLNGDGKQDAAVVVATNLGGSGTFYDLIPVLDQNGTPTQAGFDSFGDRQIVKNLQIADGRVVLDYITQGLKDPSCCPQEHRLRSYVLDNGTLHLASEQVLVSPNDQAAPLPDAILIDQPIMFDKLTTTTLQVRGRVSQVPPEKKLEYDVTDLNATLLVQGEAPLEGEVGGPGTFTFEITFDTVPTGIIKVELIDTANGILRGRSMVDLLGQ